MEVIGLTGYDRCGKDTFAKWLKRQYEIKNKKVVILPMADTLKNVASKLLNVNKELLEKFKEDGVVLHCGLEVTTARDILIDLSTALKEEFGEDIFINALAKKLLKAHADKVDVVIIPDIRFVKEAEYIKDLNGAIKGMTVKVNSKLPSCGKNGKKYEVDKIKYDIDIGIKEDGSYELGSLGLLLMIGTEKNN